MSTVVIIAAAQILRQKKEIYSLVVNGVRDIDQIAAMKRMQKKDTVWFLKDIIREANPRKKKRKPYWAAFTGAYLDVEKNQIVLTVPTDELIVANDYDKSAAKAYQFLGWFVLVLGILTAPSTSGISLIIFAGGAIAFFTLTRYTKKMAKRIEAYYDLLQIKKVVSIQSISQATQKPPEIVRKEIQDLIDKMIFVNAKIDRQADEVIAGTFPILPCDR